jgi:hypothetical protein
VPTAITPRASNPTTIFLRTIATPGGRRRRASRGQMNVTGGVLGHACTTAVHAG